MANRTFDNLPDALSAFEIEFTRKVESGYRELIESKHLYQHVALDLPKIIADIRSCLTGKVAKENQFSFWAHERATTFVIVPNQEIASGGKETRIALRLT